MLGISILTDTSSAQTPKPTQSPSSGWDAVPSTRQTTKSSKETAPADQRIVSDIQEIRAMLGGGLDREFEEIHKALQQHPASTATTGQPQAKDGSGGNVAQRVRGLTAGEMFSRELGGMVRARSESFPRRSQAETQRQLPYKLDNSWQLQQADRPVETSRYASSRDAQFSNALLCDDPRSAMRRCARELELVAGALERIEAYQNADAVRKEAANLWEKARKE